MFPRRSIAVSLFSAMLLLAAGVSSSAQTLVTTTDGHEYDGSVIAAGVNTLRMKLKETGYQIVPVQSISQIQVDVKDSEPIAGKFIDWSNGEVVLRVGDRDVAVRDGYITSVTNVGVAAGGPNVSPAEPSAGEQPSPSEPPVTPEPADTKTNPQNATM